MILPRQLLDHDTLMIAMLTIGRDIARSLSVSADASIAEICRAIGANRTSVYEQARRILPFLEQLACARPGRPRQPDTTSLETDEATGLKLTIELLDYQLEHPGAMSRQRSRTHYSPGLRRWLLARLDEWTGPLDAFADTVRVPVETLRDWLQRDRQGAGAELPDDDDEKPPVLVPRDASEITQGIARLWQAWAGSTRAFIRHAAQRFDISTGQVARVLTLLCLISPRRRKAPRHRGTTHHLSPGAMLVTDGKRIDVHLCGSGETTHRNWQAMVDQTTGCDTASVVTAEEGAKGVRQAYDQARSFLAGVVPVGLLHDNKPCYDDASLQRHVLKSGTVMIHATPARPQNKAIVEGAFGLFELRVGTIRLDDTSQKTLINSAVSEVVRAYTAATNAVPRVEWNGKSRQQVLRDTCPSHEQQRRDQEFLERLAAEHERAKRRFANPSAISAKLLDQVFERLGVLERDPSGALRKYLAAYEPAAIRRAAAIVTAKRERGALKEKYLHRYLVKVIQNQQDELDLERAAQELLELCTIEKQLWTDEEQLHYERLIEDLDDEQLIFAVAERAAHGGLPLQAAFWTERLLQTLRDASHRAHEIKKFLTRLYEAPHQRRLDLIDRITAMELALV